MQRPTKENMTGNVMGNVTIHETNFKVHISFFTEFTRAQNIVSMFFNPF